MDEMVKAISVQQPWAQMIFQTGKCVEVRNFCTNYRGTLVIHAATINDTKEFRRAGIDTRSIPLFTQKSLIGVVDLVDIYPMTESLWEELREKHQEPGEWHPFTQKFAWVITNPKLIVPIPYKGMPALFSLASITVKQFKFQ